MIERQQELKRRYHRKKKMMKLKGKLVEATGEERTKILYKIKRLSPWWTEASLTQKTTTPKSVDAKEKKERMPKSNKGPTGPRGQQSDKN